MIIVLEGCDGAGKSTLARYLTEKYDLKYHHEGPPPPNVDMLDYYGSVVESFRWMIHRKEIKGVVIDRLALGERVYGPIYRGVDRLGEDGWVLMKRVLRAADALNILCAPPFKVCLENWQRNKHNEMLQKVQQLEKVYMRYIDLVQRDDLAFHWVYDYTQPKAQEELEVVAMWAGEALPPGIIGAPKSRYLFVGEKGAKPNALSADLPFFGMENSSGYLNRALWNAEFKETDIALTNAERCDGQVIEWPKFEVTVALGKVAYKECVRRGIAAVDMPHPQFWKRFHAHEFNRYVDMLRQIRA